jgi:hypothetical protein
MNLSTISFALVVAKANKKKKPVLGGYLFDFFITKCAGAASEHVCPNK